MLIDCHVHTAALVPGHGSVSSRVRQSLSFRWLRHQLRIPDGTDAGTEAAMECALFRALDAAPELDAAVVLAFDAVYTRDGVRDHGATHFWVTNDYVASLAARHPKIRFGASIHPYRPDAIAELERCVRAGAVLCKWLPITQLIDPADPRCFPMYEALAHYGLPLLSHTGWEHTLPRLDPSVAAPARLVPALERGVTVIAAHCGTARVPRHGLFVGQFRQLARTHERLYGDTAALNLPPRWASYDELLGDEVVRAKLVHGSDWPIPAYPRPWRHRWPETRALVAEREMLRRDLLIKRAIGFDDDYWQRAARVLRLDDQPSRNRESN